MTQQHEPSGAQQHAATSHCQTRCQLSRCVVTASAAQKLLSVPGAPDTVRVGCGDADRVCGSCVLAAPKTYSRAQVEAHCRAEKEKLLRNDVEKGKVHAGAAVGGCSAAAAAAMPVSLSAVSGVVHPGAAMQPHPGAMPHHVAVSAAGLVSDGEQRGLQPCFGVLAGNCLAGNSRPGCCLALC